MERRIGVSANQNSILEDLIRNVPGENYALFETKQKALMFAAALGYHLQRSQKLGSRDAGSAIRFDIFEKNLDEGFVHCLAVAESEDLGILSDANEEQLAVIFEEYASAGLVEMQSRLIGRPEPLQALVDLMNSVREVSTDETLEGLDPSILSDLLRA